MNNKEAHAGYYLIGLLAVIVSTPSVIYILTLNASEFEGAKALGQLYLIPFVFVFLLLTWFVLHSIYHTRGNYYKTAGMVFLTSIIISVGSFSTYFIKDHQDRVQRKRNSQKCRNQYEEAYEGMIIKAKDNYIIIRKMDDGGQYKEFYYYFKLSHEVIKDFYIGQKISKKGHTEFYTFVSKNGHKKVFKIPCYN